MSWSYLGTYSCFPTLRRKMWSEADGRHDYYQTATHVIAAVYLKGYAGDGVKEQVEVKFSSDSVCSLCKVE